MRMYLVLLQKKLANTSIDAQYIYQEAIVEGRSFSLVRERMTCSNRYFEGSCSKVSKSDCWTLFL